MAPIGFVNVATASKELGISGRQVCRMIVAGKIPAEKVGTNYLIRRSDLAKVPKVRKPGPKPKGK
jgi:excisionase family DNA binding protein